MFLFIFGKPKAFEKNKKHLSFFKKNANLAEIIYILKTAGTNQIPGFVQIRDKNFALVALFNARSLLRSLKTTRWAALGERIAQEVANLPYGQLKQIKI